MIRRNLKRGQLVRRRFEATQNWQEWADLRNVLSVLEDCSKRFVTRE